MKQEIKDKIIGVIFAVLSLAIMIGMFFYITNQMASSTMSDGEAYQNINEGVIPLNYSPIAIICFVVVISIAIILAVIVSLANHKVMEELKQKQEKQQ